MPRRPVASDYLGGPSVSEELEQANARPQDVGRAHRRSRPGLAPETAAILERYRSAMRAELGDLLEELRPPPAGEAPIVFGAPPPRARPPLPDRLRLWELAIKLGRELGAAGLAELEEEPAPAGGSGSGARGAARRSTAAPRLSARERRSLGAS